VPITGNRTPVRLCTDLLPLRLGRQAVSDGENCGTMVEWGSYAAPIREGRVEMLGTRVCEGTRLPIR
jgi:hypothetical protein